MRDRSRVIAGLGVFVVLAALPIWHALWAAGDISRPELELPQDESQCIEDTEFMRNRHQDFLNQWRNAVVRDGETEYTSTAGEIHTMSLTGTCLSCHDNRDTFCTRCHDYANVEPRCWDCHVERGGS
jgi:hypothetical protein